LKQSTHQGVFGESLAILLQKPTYRHFICLFALCCLAVLPTLHRLDTHERHMHHGVSWHSPTHHDHFCDICGIALFVGTAIVSFLVFFTAFSSFFLRIETHFAAPFAPLFQARAPPTV
jgi:hypothetical protein